GVDRLSCACNPAPEQPIADRIAAPARFTWPHLIRPHHRAHPTPTEVLMDALDELEQMHEMARSDFRKIASAGTTDQAGLWAKLHSSLKLHEQIEEQFVYDPVSQDLAGNEQLEQFHEQHEMEASQANQLMDQLGNLEPTDSQWLSTLLELQTMMERHMEE